VKAYLLLEDGNIFTGESFGAEIESFGEVVFNTGLTGYQEILTDPSYCGQIVNMTYPLIGNYGTNRDDFESIKPFVSGFITREYCETPSNWRSTKSFSDLLSSYDIPGLHGIDTRKLTRIIRNYGTLKGVIYYDDAKKKMLQEKLKDDLPIDQVKQVSTKNVQHFPGKKYRIALVDYGCKRGILRELLERDCEVVLFPYDATTKQILDIEPNGVLLSNGPGDPRDLMPQVKTIRELMGKVPIFGICLGHQLLALASGAEVTKLKFGHRGSNHPVKDLITGKIHISSQNHSYAVVEETLKKTDFDVSHIAMNDRSVEGLQHKKLPIFSVQYHPEASPGPDDNSYLFDRFLEKISSVKGSRSHAIT
jgi:carbamoyl-phosphate synthase small subunit